jgi:hypothetical protein
MFEIMSMIGDLKYAGKRVREEVRNLEARRDAIEMELSEREQERARLGAP